MLHSFSKRALRRLRLKRLKLYPHDQVVRKVSEGIRASDVHFYIYDPQTDFLSRVGDWSWIVDGALAGDLRPPGVADCSWQPFLHRLGHRGGDVIDVGGFKGYTAAWFARDAARVFCFEPNAVNQRHIRELLEVRRLTNVEMIPCAVADTIGVTTLYVKPRTGQHSLADIGGTKSIDSVEVNVTTLDAFAAERRIDHIATLKIDAEGFEPDVLRGAAGLLRAHRVGGIVFEYSPKLYRERGLEPNAPIDMLRQFGYRIEMPDGSPISLESEKQRDLFAFPV